MTNRNESDEIALLKMEIAFLKVENKALVMELSESKNEHVIQNSEKQKRADELVIANKELVFQNSEKQKRADELVIANNELIFQNEEKQKRADELEIANTELFFENEEKQKRADELVIANRHLDRQHEDKKVLTIKLTKAINELRATEEYLRSYIEGLEEMIFMTSHKVRHPITQILGISNLIDQSVNYSESELKMIIDYIRPCAVTLDDFTKELSLFMRDLQNTKKVGIEVNNP